MLRSLTRQFWRDDSGYVLKVHLIFILTILLLGCVSFLRTPWRW